MFEEEVVVVWFGFVFLLKKWGFFKETLNCCLKSKWYKMGLN